MRRASAGTPTTIVRAAGNGLPEFMLAHSSVANGPISAITRPVLPSPYVVTPAGGAVSFSRRATICEIAWSWARRCFWISSASFSTASASL